MKKYLLLLAGLGFLIVIMRLVIIPLVMEVVASDTFLVDSKDAGSPNSITNPMTDLAYRHCNKHIKDELGDKVTVSFPETAPKAWSFGNYQYIVHSEFTVGDSTAKAKPYTCRITYDNGDDLAGVDDSENWTIDGISGLENL